MVRSLFLIAAAVAGAVANMMDMTPSAATAMDIQVLKSYMGGSSSWSEVKAPSSPMGMTHEITVGGAALTFSPPTISATAGDIVVFTFMTKNHTVTQSTFAEPCTKMANGMDSGFMPNVNNTVNPPPQFMVQVMDTKPMCKLFSLSHPPARQPANLLSGFYCRQKTPASHCGKGMVFSINPTADKSADAFKAAAMMQAGGAAMGSSTMMMPATATAASAAQASVVQGMGMTQSDGSCACSCLCGVNDFLPGTGMNNFGGMGGKIPMA
jgi:plastocyanin